MATYKVGKYCIGGLHGECPTWIVPTIFYHGDKTLLSAKGDFDRETLKQKIEEAISITTEYKLVLGLDVVLPSIESIERVLPFLAEFNIPIFLDSADPMIRAESYKVSRDLGLTEYAIANGLYVDSPVDEIEALRESRLGKAVLIAFNPRNPYESLDWVNRVSLLDEKLLPLARESGIELRFVDFVAIDPGSIAICGEAIEKFKSLYDAPAGCAPANALGNVNKSTVTVDEVYGSHGGVAAYLRMKGADFIMIGPLSRVKYVAPIIAIVDGLLGYNLRRKGFKLADDHPMKGLLKKIQKLFNQPILPGKT
ncbi:MAG: tetrahydromethanopterin S-methyltransferase subunit H [Desulfurococcaceae archaeon]